MLLLREGGEILEIIGKTTFFPEHPVIGLMNLLVEFGLCYLFRGLK